MVWLVGVGVTPFSQGGGNERGAWLRLCGERKKKGVAANDPLPLFFCLLIDAALAPPMSGSKRSRKVAFQEEVEVASEKKKRQEVGDGEGDESGRSGCALIRVCLQLVF